MDTPRGTDVAHATAWGLVAATLLMAGIYFGSRGLRDFDPALVPYAGASVFAAFGIGYRYSMWLRRLCFAVNGGLLLYVFDFDRRLRRASGDHE